MISQELFDETLLENEDLFELSPEDALKETIEQLEKSNQSVKHLCLSHPLSEEGKGERAERAAFSETLKLLDECVKEDGSIEILPGLVEALEQATVACRSSTAFTALFDQQEGLYTLLSLLNCVQGEDDFNEERKMVVLKVTCNCLISVLSSASGSQRDLARGVLHNPLLQLEWSTEDEELKILLLRLLQSCCRRNEANKKTWTVKKMALRRLVLILNETSNEELVLACCSFINTLCRFDDFRESDGPTIASGHECVMELSRCGLVPALKVWTDKADARLMPTLLTTLRVMAVHDDIVQSMVAVGLLDTAQSVLASCTELELSTATIGMLRNVCANDEIKTSLCTSSVLNSLLSIAEKYPDHALLQEHVCGLLGAMALRKPKNASLILAHDGARAVLLAMTKHPTARVLQRQGALAIRNLASRATPEEKLGILDTLDAEVVLQYAGVHGGCADEAYAALRDLGCEAKKTTIHVDGRVSTRPEMFGEVKSSFRAVYD